MNIHFNKIIGIFPLECNVRNLEAIKEIMDWNKIAGNIYDKDYFYFSPKYPSIRHCLSPNKLPKSELYHNSITDKEARKFMDELQVESPLDLNCEENQIYLQKRLLKQIDIFIVFISRPGQGKSSLCSAFYKVLYGLNREIFSISNSTLSFTKGLWTLKQRE
jgi:hypothetical protein